MSETKPREWWIVDGTAYSDEGDAEECEVYCRVFHPNKTFEIVHVVEYSAYLERTKGELT